MSKRQRPIILCIDSPGWGGSEMDLIRVIEWVGPDQFHVVKGKQLCTELQQFFTQKGIPIEEGVTFSARLRFMFKGLFRSFQLLKKFPESVYVIWAHHPDSNRWLQFGFALSRHKFIVIERLIPDSKKSFEKSRLSIPIKKFVTHRASCTVLNSYSQINHYKHLFNPLINNIVVIQGSRSVDLINERVHALRLDRDQLRDNLSLPKNGYMVLCVGRLDSQKSQIDLIRAFALLPADMSIFLVLVGDGDDSKLLQQEIKKIDRGNIYLAGHQPDPIPWLAAADIFVLPSISEGLPGVLIEAMASKLPCIATGIVGNQDLIENQKTGVSVPIRSPDLLSASILNLCINQELAKKIASAGFNLVKSRHDFPLEKKSWQDLFNELYIRSDWN